MELMLVEGGTEDDARKFSMYVRDHVARPLRGNGATANGNRAVTAYCRGTVSLRRLKDDIEHSSSQARYTARQQRLMYIVDVQI